MSKESIHEKAPQVKRERRTVPDGAALTVADILKLSNRAQGPKKNLASKIKWAFRTYIDKCPGLTSTTKRVACFLVDWYQLRDGYARPPNSRISHELMIGRATVERAVATLHDLGLIYTKSGGPTRRRGLGTVASRYVPNFWLVINRDTGEIIKNAKYDFTPSKPIAGAGDYPQNDGRGAYPQNDGRVGPVKPIRGAGDYPQNDGGYLSTSADANASPASADAAAGSTPAPQENQLEILPPDSENVKVIFGQFATVAPRCFNDTQPDGIHVEHLIDILLDIIDDGGKNDVEFLRPWCEDDSIDKRLPNHGTEYVHIVLDGRKTPMTCEMGKAGTSGTWTPDDWVAFELRS